MNLKLPEFKKYTVGCHAFYSLAMSGADIGQINNLSAW